MREPFLSAETARLTRKVGKALKSRRRRLGVSQSAAARMVRLPQPLLSNLENGKLPNVETATLIKSGIALGCRIRIILEPV